MINTPLLILGAGTFAIETLDIAETIGGFTPLGFVNSLEQPEPGLRHAGLPVFWSEALPYGPGACLLVAGIVSPRRRGLIARMEERGYGFARLIHPSAMISRRATIGVGCVINAGVVISAGATVAEHVIINRGALIGHDGQIGAYTTIGPGANLAGMVRVGAEAIIGVGAVVSDHLTIGARAQVGAGTTVVRNVAEGAVVVGLAGRAIPREDQR